MQDWLPLVALLAIGVFLLLAFGTRVVARSWFDEKYKHMRRMLGSEKEKE